jgi:hypothetical protein
MENIPISIDDLDNYPGSIPGTALVFVGAIDGKLYKTTVTGLLTSIGVPNHEQAIGTISGLQTALDNITGRLDALEV